MSATPFARRTLSGGAISDTVPLGMGAADGSFALNLGTNWPSGSGGNFYVVVDRGLNTEEKIFCSATSGKVVTVASGGRGAVGSSASSHAAGCSIAVCHVAQDDDEANQLVANLANLAKGSIPLGGGTSTLPGSLAALAEGSLMIGKGTGNNPAALAIDSTANHVLATNGTDPVWQYPALTVLSGHIATNVTLADGPTTTKIFDTASLAVGTWLVTMGCTFDVPGAALASIELNAAIDSATATLTGQLSSGNNNLVAAQEGGTYNASIQFVAVVTVAGTLQLQGYNSSSSSTAVAYAATPANSFANATGYTAVRIA